MRRTVLVVVVCSLALNAYAQFNLEFVSGYGSYSLGNIRQYQDNLRSTYYPAGAQVTTAFPAYWFYGANAKWTFNGALFGISYTQGSTAGQIYYRDYSGFMRDDNLFSYTAVRSIIAKKWSFANGKISVSVDPGLGAAFGKMVLQHSFNASNGTESRSYTTITSYKSMNPFLEPTISMSGKLGPFGFTAFAGYHLDLKNSDFRDEQAGAITTNSIPVTMNLSGYRVGGSVGFYLSRKNPASFTRFFIGPGGGLDYGGIIGVNAMIMASEHIGFFAGAGYNLNTLGVNGGVRVYTNKQTERIRPFFSGMYGYNSVIIITNRSEWSKTFYGTTIGAGIDLRARESNFWTFAVHVPIRGNDVNDYKSYLTSQGAKFNFPLLPLAVSVGFRFAVKT
jgi:hypothetical protein